MRKKLECIKKYLCDYDICSGCGICEALFGSENVKVCINEKGLFRPKFREGLSLSESQKEILIRVCPALDMRPLNNNKVQLFGNIESALIGWATDPNLRFMASSGGCVSAFLIYLLESGSVDGIIHVTRKEDAIHCYSSVSRTREDIIRNCGSLYMPTKSLSDISHITCDNERYAFVGKGCDIKALKRYNNIAENKINIFYYIGIMCGGTPSYQGLKKILDIGKMDLESLQKLQFRGEGWPGSFKAVSTDGRTVKITYNEAWGKHLGPTSGVACKVCFDGIAEESDITFGDAWHCNDINSPSFDEADGRNLILIRTTLGLKAFNAAVAKGAVQVEEKQVSIKEISNMQPSQCNRRYLAKYKMLGVRLLGYKYPLVNWKQLDMLSKNKKTSLIQKGRTVMGAIKRAKNGKKR